MRLNPYLVFNGQCKEAFELYEKTLGGKIEMMRTHAETPMAGQSPPEWQDKIMHAQLAVGDEVLMARTAHRRITASPKVFGCR